MAMTTLALCSAALVKIGAQPLAALDDGSAEATVAGHLYPLVRDSLLSAHPWGFATRQVRLDAAPQAPEADYAHAFVLPGDFLRAISIGTGTRGRSVPYRVVAGTLQADADAIVLTYVFRPTEDTFPAYFDHVLVAHLAPSSACRSPSTRPAPKRCAGRRNSCCATPAGSTASRTRRSASRTSA